MTLADLVHLIDNISVFIGNKVSKNNIIVQVHTVHGNITAIALHWTDPIAGKITMRKEIGI